MKYCVLTFGCRTNQADSCDVERGLRAQGGLPAAPEAADVVVVNTCTVTAAADQASRSAIRRIARLNPSARIIATGCYATRNPDEMAALPGVADVVPNSVKAAIAHFPSFPVSPFPSSSVPQLPGFSVPGRTAYPIRVQTGCDERCAYCIVPGTRGASTSRPLQAVVDETRAIAQAGYKELWVTGVHLGSYGRDLVPAASLLDLLAALERAALGTDLAFRLSSIEPMDCGDGILDAMAASAHFLPHFHLPLQHAADRVLASMRRPYTLERFRAAVDGIRSRLPDAAIGTDLIAGFPGETEDDFDVAAAYLRESPLTHVHVFPYSPRPGTEAARMSPRVPAGEVRRRATCLRAIAAALNSRFVERQLGRERPALTLGDGTTALTDNYLKLRIPPGRPRNERIRARVVSVTPLRGEVVA
jgi:threonylcarbamoyladenosine tRNA methylthiotransferase MtaB